MMKPFSSLPDSTFLPKGSNDPLVHNTQDFFWYYVEPHFNPIGTDDLQILQSICGESSSPGSEQEPITKRRKDTAPLLQQRLQEYPLSQRLTAALLDEGKGEASAVKPLRSNVSEEDIWINDTLEASREVNQMVEKRIRNELDYLGLLDHETDNPVQMESRMDQWHLQNLIAKNESTKQELSNRVAKDLSTQSARREQKQRENEAEIKYLESMIERQGKRGKGRFTKILNQLHPHRHMNLGEPLNTAQKGSGAVVEKGVSKKRRRKSTASEHVPRKSPDYAVANKSDSTDAVADHIAEIIKKHDNQASFEEIVKEFRKRAPQLAGDIKDAKKKVTSCISSSKKSFRFRKLPDGVTYSVTRV